MKILKHAFQIRGYQEIQINSTMAEMNFDNRSAALQQKPKTRNKILPFVTKCNPVAPNVKEILLNNWYLTPNQPELNVIFPQPPIVSCRKTQPLKDMLVGAKL